MEDLCSRVAEVDFGPGSAEYKQALSDRQWDEASIYIFAPSLQGTKLSLTRLFTVGIHKAAKRILEHTGFLSSIKKGWRVRLRPPQ
jgi:CelD/BcsL family acetyltransferase involved in cellulose biosynthesis